MGRHDDRWHHGDGHHDDRHRDDRRDDRHHDHRRDTGDELVKDLGRIGVELARGISAHVLERIEREGERHLQSKLERRMQRRRDQLERKRARRLEKRDRRYAGTTRAEAVTLAVLAAAFFVFAAVQPHFWWLLFIGLALGLRAAGMFGFHARQDGEQADEAEAARARERESRDPRLVRIDDTCEKLLAALKDATDDVRAFLSKPEETVQALQKTAHELARREVALRALASPEDDARLLSERDGLAARAAAETDAVTRDRLQKALDALDDRRRQTDDIRRQASRLDAEGTRLSYTLEGLYAQVLRMKTAGTTDAGEGLRKSLDQLKAEVSALADALEATSRATPLAGAEPPEPFDEAGRAPRARVRDP